MIEDPSINVVGLKFLTPISESRREQKSDGSHFTVLEVSPSSTPDCCPQCRCSNLHRHGVRRQEYVDIPQNGEPTVLLVHRKRWRCKACNKLFPDPLPDMNKKRRVTQRLIEYVCSRVTVSTFSEVGREIGMSDKSVRAIFDDCKHELMPDSPESKEP